jgi:hypothetical protein
MGTSKNPGWVRGGSLIYLVFFSFFQAKNIHPIALFFAVAPGGFEHGRQVFVLDLFHAPPGVEQVAAPAAQLSTRHFTRSITSSLVPQRRRGISPERATMPEKNTRLTGKGAVRRFGNIKDLAQISV